MDAREIVSTLYRFLSLGDSIDDAGGGIRALTNGDQSMREVCRIELGQFLLYLAAGCSYLNEAQTAILNLVISEDVSKNSADELKRYADTISTPNPANNLTLSVFMHMDMQMSHQNGEDSSALTDIMISIYKAFGQLFVGLNENIIARNRYESYIERLENCALSGEYSNNDDILDSMSTTASDDFEIRGNVLKKYTGDDVYVTVPDGISRIDDYAFSEHTAIKSIVLPSSVKTIGESAFRYCDNMERINLPEGLNEIESDAFTHCDNLTNIEIPSTVDTIGGDSFLFCNHIKRIRIPSTLTDIGNDAFMYCSGLETVVVYGEGRNDFILENLKEHFPDHVKIVWEGNEADKTKKNTSKKTVAEKRESQSAKRSTGKYNDRVSFGLPEGYEFVEGKNDDGDRTVEIKINPSINDDGETVYECTVAVTDETVEDNASGKTALDVMEEDGSGCDVNRRLVADPEALIRIKHVNFSVMGVEMGVQLIDLAVALTPEDVIHLKCVRYIGRTTDDDEELQQTLDRLKTVWESMLIDGKNVTAADMDIGSLMNEIAEKEAAEQEKGETPIDHHIHQENNYMIMGNRWRMELPYGVRYRYDKRDEEEFDGLRFEIDRREIGYCFLGRTLQEQRNAASRTLLILTLICRDGVEKIFEVKLRDDELMEVKLTSYLDKSGKSAFEVLITEKENSVETRIIMNPLCDIDDIEEVLENLKSGEPTLEHPFGAEWEQCYEIALRMAASVSLIDEKTEVVDFDTKESVLNGFSFKLPSGLKSIKDEDGIVHYLPSTKELTSDSFNDLADYPYCIVLESTKIDLPQEEPDENLQLPGINSLARLKVMNGVVRASISLGTVPLWVSIFENGFKAAYLAGKDTSLVLNIYAVTNNNDCVIFGIRSYSGHNPEKRIRIARNIFNSIHYANDKECVPIAYPVLSDIMHEHMTLVTSGSYSTRRDADFIGQSIRSLMKKCGNTSEKAYQLMQIPDDDYTLDVDARRLAKVFRLEDGMFDPYADTEAMICLGMFSDARMFHVLRSLAWTVSCKADREGRDLMSYNFEELDEIGKLICLNNFNYSTESYCSGLCSHYDWRVFYVPDAYIGSDCEAETDLRELCGKENRSGNTLFLYIPGHNDISSMDRTNEIISRNEETLESLEALRKDLIDLLPVMQTIYDGLMKDRNRSEKLEGVLSDALNAWCALAVAAKEPFYSEEANDAPEVDAGLNGPMNRPVDDFANSAPAKENSPASKQTNAKKPIRPIPNGETLELDGATVIKPGQFAGNMSLRNIVIPEGITEIGEEAFQYCMFLETVVLPKSLKKIGKMAFMGCRSLHQVEIPEGIEEICDHAFGATNNLKEVHLPDSLQRVDYYIFGLGGDSPYATAYMSGELASRLQASRKDSLSRSAISARRYVIDGVGYENMYDYVRQSSSSAGLTASMESKSFDEYRAEMETAYREGKSLEDMIEAGRKAVDADEYSQHAFEQAIQNLDRNAIVTFSERHFVLTGFGDYEKEVIGEIEKRGGIVHSSMVKTADYLIVHLESPGAAKVKKALEWRQKGAYNQIVSDYQMWRAIFGISAAVICDKDNTLIGEDVTPTAMVTADSLDAKKTTAPVEMEKPDVTEMKSAAPKAEKQEVPSAKKSEAMTASNNIKREYSAEEWIAEFGQYIEKDSQIEFKDKIFVFDPRTKTSGNDEKTVGYGGIIRQSVSSKTDYLVVSSDCNALATLHKAIELKKNGCKIKIVLKEDFQAVLDRIPAIAQKLYNIAEDGTLDLNGETKICSEAFKANEELKTIRIPEGVTYIGDRAFQECKNLKTVILPETLTSIGAHAFDQCTSLENVTFKEGLKEIGNFAFNDCTSLENVTFNKRLEMISDYAFSGCESLKSVTFNEGLETIGEHAFSKCESLESITFNKGPETIGSYAFWGCESLESITFNKGLETIGSYAFWGCESLESITFNKGLETIGSYAFWSCESLKSVTFNEGLKKISEWAFSGCTSLENVTFNEGLETIGEHAFSGCESLENVTFKEGLETISNSAFWGCESLKSVTLLVSEENALTAWLEGVPSYAFPTSEAVLRISESLRGWAIKNNIERNFDRIEYLSSKSQPVQPQNTLSADVQAAAKSSRSNASERIKQLRSQIDALNQEYNEAKGIWGIFKRKRIQKQLDQLFDELRQIEES